MQLNKCYKTILLSFNSPVHFSGTRPNEYTSSEITIKSDTLIAAIMQAWSIMGHSDWIPKSTQEFGHFNLIASNLFPYTTLNNNEQLYFLPKMRLKNKMENSIDNSIGKKMKKILYLDHYIYEALANGIFNEVHQDHLKGKFMSSKPINTELWESNVVARIKKSWDQSDPSLFYTDRITFKEGCGLYFIYEADEAMQHKLYLALDYLAEEGLGTDRSVGNGKFTWSLGELTMNQPINANAMSNLSLYLPANFQELTDMLQHDPMYEMTKRGGWISEPYHSLRKKTVYMFTEGSVFYNNNFQSVYGRVIDLKPAIDAISHPIWRDGRALFIPVLN